MVRIILFLSFLFIEVCFMTSHMIYSGQFSCTLGKHVWSPGVRLSILGCLLGQFGLQPLFPCFSFPIFSLIFCPLLKVRVSKTLLLQDCILTFSQFHFKYFGALLLGTQITLYIKCPTVSLVTFFVLFYSLFKSLLLMQPLWLSCGCCLHNTSFSNLLFLMYYNL